MLTRSTMDFIFRFDLDPLSQGALTRTGESTHYFCIIDGTRTPYAWKIPANTVAEIEGIEIYMTPDESSDPTVYNPLDYVRLEINDVELENISLNELMAPFYPAGGTQVGRPAFRDAGTCVNIGKAILMGGPTWSPTVKMKEGDELRIAVKSPRAQYGGVTISNVLFVRIHVCTANTDDLATTYPNGFIDQALPGMTKRVPADIDYWTQTHGGVDAKPPYMERYITYAKNITASNDNQQYIFSRRAQTVDSAWQNLDWEIKDDEMVQLTHIGLAPDESSGYNAAPNVAYMTIPHYPEQLVCYTASPYQLLNAFPMPVSRVLFPISGGPGELPVPVTLYRENAALSVRDRGDSFVAWSTTNVGIMLAVWGYRYKLL